MNSSAISKITIVALGDSTTAGTPYAPSYGDASRGPGNPQAPYTYWVAQRHPEWTVLNRGVNGERSDEIRARFATQVLPAHPKYVIILAGVNDTYSGYPSERTEQNLRAMYREAEAHGIVPILCTILPFDQAAPQDQDKIRHLNNWILLESRTSQSPFIDLNQRVRDPQNPDRLRGSPDGLHPDLPTYKLMGEAVADQLDHLENVR